MEKQKVNENRISLSIVTVIFVLFILGCNIRNTPIFRKLSEQQERSMRKAAEEMIEKLPVYQELNNLCTKEIPVYESFSLINIHSSWKKNEWLSYYYFSDADWSKVRVFYKDYFSKNGWQYIQDYDTNWGSNKIEVKRESYRVILYNKGLGENANFALHCEKISENNSSETNSK